MSRDCLACFTKLLVFCCSWPCPCWFVCLLFLAPQTFVWLFPPSTGPSVASVSVGLFFLISGSRPQRKQWSRVWVWGPPSPSRSHSPRPSAPRPPCCQVPDRLLQLPLPGPADHLPHASQPSCLWLSTQQGACGFSCYVCLLDEAPALALASDSGSGHLWGLDDTTQGAGWILISDPEDSGITRATEVPLSPCLHGLRWGEASAAFWRASVGLCRGLPLHLWLVLGVAASRACSPGLPSPHFHRLGLHLQMKKQALGLASGYAF